MNQSFDFSRLPSVDAFWLESHLRCILQDVASKPPSHSGSSALRLIHPMQRNLASALRAQGDGVRVGVASRESQRTILRLLSIWHRAYDADDYFQVAGLSQLNAVDLGASQGLIHSMCKSLERIEDLEEPISEGALESVETLYAHLSEKLSCGDDVVRFITYLRGMIRQTDNGGLLPRQSDTWSQCQLVTRWALAHGLYLPESSCADYACPLGEPGPQELIA